MAFTQLRSNTIPALDAQVHEYEHPASGARHIHLATQGPDMVFLVAFPTVPDASDGRAHILEHLALCGSARYPVRDPFFSMLRRSTAHFMNAMTYPDRTVYPFASTGKTDFFNLLDVYLDAAFFPRLDYLDFLQEGWRLAYDDAGRLGYHGVVFNEMKGAFSDPVRALAGGIHERILEGTTYACESGGDPLHIPSLTHADLLEFHATHYHPSQAVFMTAGPLDPLEVQAAIQERVLARLPGRLPRLLPQLATGWEAPQAAAIAIPAQEHGVQIAWLMGESADPQRYYRAQLLEAGLLGNASAPLSLAMETAGFGRPAALNGVDASGRQTVFHLGMEGLRPDQVRAARRRIWSALEQTAERGAPQALLEAALRDLRFGQREINGGGLPDPLRRLLHALPHAMVGGDVMNGFDPGAALEQLRQEIADPAFFRGMVRELLESPARLDAEVIPDAEYFSDRQRIEDERLAALETSLPAPEKQRIRTEAALLQERQRQPVDNSVLPRIHPRDVSPMPRPAFALPPAGNGVTAVSIASNGISYARALYEVSDMDPEEWPWLQLYADLLPDLGVGDMAYEEADAWRHRMVPHFDVGLQVFQALDGMRPLRLYIDFYAKGLREENRAIAEVLSTSVGRPRFDEHERLAFLIDSMVQEMRNDLAEDGDHYARLAATAPLSLLRHFEDSTKGAASLPFYAELHRQSQTPEGLERIAARLAALHQRITARMPEVIAAGMERDGTELAALLALPGTAAVSPPPSLPRLPLSNAALHAPAQVNHCFAAWAVPGLDHPDAPALAVLGEVLTNQVLHQALREEGGAYGGQAGYHPGLGIFTMMSYRDPRLAATFADFERALAWVADAGLPAENLEEAIICVVQDLDRPRTPYADAMRAWEWQRQGVTEAMRQCYRHGVLHCTVERVKAVAAAWLQGKPASRAAFAGASGQELVGLELVDLVRLAS